MLRVADISASGDSGFVVQVLLPVAAAVVCLFLCFVYESDPGARTLARLERFAKTEIAKFL